MAEQKAFASRMAEFFGRKEGQSIGQFAAELKALTPEDKLWFVGEFNRNGMPTAPPSAPLTVAQ